MSFSAMTFTGCALDMAPQNMAVVEHMATNIIRTAPGKQSLTVRSDETVQAIPLGH